MPPTTHDADTAHWYGDDDDVHIGHFYLDVPRRRLHCLNDAARHFRSAGVPLLESDAALAELRTLDGGAVRADEWPLTVAARQGRLAEAAFVLTKPGQPPRRLKYSVTPMR